MKFIDRLRFGAMLGDCFNASAYDLSFFFGFHLLLLFAVPDGRSCAFTSRFAIFQAVELP